MKFKINPAYEKYSSQITEYILNFDKLGESYGDQDRNTLKLFNLDDILINVKSFKLPNLINKLVYRYFRKSKAQRSFEHANHLIKLNIGTPQPIGYYEFTSLLGFKQSYYISEHLQSDYTYRDLTFDYSIPDHEQILRLFTRFTYRLHENDIFFLDHSPGNTLIRKTENSYEFFLVDLNRMEFRPLDFNARIKNFERLCKHREMVEIMSDEYAKLIEEPYDKVFELMWNSTNEFQRKFQRKKRVKKKLLFWRSNE